MLDFPAEIKIVKSIIRMEEYERSGQKRQQPILVAFDKENREYVFKHRYYDGGEWHDVATDVICYDPSHDPANQPNR